MTYPPALLLSLLPIAVLASPPPTTDPGNLRIYRCVGSNGTVALQDAPCTQGRQEVRQMIRPQDPPPRRASTDQAPAPTPAAAGPREIRHVFVAPPRPMYECVRDDGERYVSDSNEGNPRWVPLWTTAWLPGSRHTWTGGGRGQSHGSGHGYGHGHAPPTVGMGVSVPAGNILVRDSCHALPPSEVCARLRDQHWALGRRYNSALQGDRDAIAREQRSITARLDQDCGG